MEINDLENIANREKLNIVNWKMKPKAKIVDKYIFMDYSNIHTYVEEKELLAEEIAHYYTDTYYTFNSSKSDIDRAEYKSNKWKCTALVTKEALRKAKEKGLNTLYEIAEELCVKEETVQFAYNYYMKNG